jgi:hypothetical protein
VFSLPNSPCSQNGEQPDWPVLVPKSSITEKDGMFTIEDKYVEGHMAGQIVHAKDGRSWLCAR